MSNQQQVMEPVTDDSKPEEYCKRPACGKPIFKDEPRYRYTQDIVYCDDCGTIVNCQS